MSKPAWLIGRALRLAGVPCAEEIAMMLQKRSADPAPTASMYLYGTPSDSGNIGLRSEESVTYYDGAVLPLLPEWDKTKYPYAVLTILEWTELHISLFCFDSEVKAKPYGASGKLSWKVPVGTTCLRSYLQADSKETLCLQSFSEPIEIEITSSISAAAGSEIWANHTIHAEDGSAFLESPIPIPVSGLVGYSYNGTVLPDIGTVYTEEYQEQYPAAVITQYVRDGRYSLAINSNAPFLVNDSGKIVLRVNLGNNRCVWLNSRGWRSFEYSNTSMLGIDIEDETGNAVHNVVWANCDIKDVDGSIYLAASTPIPVYE